MKAVIFVNIKCYRKKKNKTVKAWQLKCVDK